MAEGNGFELGTAWVQISPSMRGLRKAIQSEVDGVNANKASSNVEIGLNNAFRRAARAGIAALGAVSTMTLVAGFGQITAEVIRSSDATTKFAQTLEFAGKSKSEIEALTKASKDYADKTVYGLADVQNITAQLGSNGVANFQQLVEAAGNLNAVAGGNAETFKSVGLVLTQTAGYQKLTSENWNQLADAIPGATGRIQQALLDAGAYTGDFRKAMEESQISAEEFNAAIMTLGMDGAAQKAATSTSTFEGAWGQFMASLVSGGQTITDRVKPAITGFLTDLGAGADKVFQFVNTTLIPGVEGLYNLFAKGDFTGSQNLFGLEEDSAAVDFLFNLRDALTEIFNYVRSDVVPTVKDVFTTITSWSGWRTIGTFLNDTLNNVGTIKAMVAAWVAWKVAMTGWNVGVVVVALVKTRIETIKNTIAKVKDLAATVALKTMYAVDFVKGLVATTVALARQTAAWVYQNVILKGARGAVIAFTVAQRALNLAMTANPIGLIVAAIGLLVAAVVVAYKKSDTFRTIVNNAWQAIWDKIKAVIDWFKVNVLPTLQKVWGGVSDGASKAGSTIRDVWNRIWSVIKTVIDWFQTNVLPIVSNVFNAIKTVIEIVVKLAIIYIAMWWHNLMSVVTWLSDTFGPAVSWVWERVKAGVQVLWEFMKLAWQGILLAVQIVVDWFQTSVLPRFQFVWAVITAGFNVLKDSIAFAWEWVKDKAGQVVSWFVVNVLPTLQTVWEGIKSGFNTMKDTVTTAWNTVKSSVDAVKTWFTDTLKPKIEDVATGIKDAFDTMKDQIKTVWDKVKEYAAKPINFVIETVYSNGIKSMADKIADNLGLDITLPTINKIPGYATGGVLPGYTPGRDVYHFYSPDGGGALKLSGGEAIMRPEWVRAVGGAPAVARMNAAAQATGGKRIPGGDVGSAVRFAAFADGGIWERVKSAAVYGAKAAWDVASSVASFASDVVSDPAAAVEALIRIPTEQALKLIPGKGIFTEMGKSLPLKWVDGISDWFSNKASESPVAGTSSDIVSAARKAIGVPYVWGGSSIPPGVDCSGLVYWAARQMGSSIPRLTAAGYQSRATGAGNPNNPGTLLFWGSPAWHVAIASGGGRMVEAPRPGSFVRETAIWGNPTARVMQFDSGGWLEPGARMTVNKTGKPEPVFTSTQWQTLERMLAAMENDTRTLVIRDVDDRLIGRMRVEADGRIIEAQGVGFGG